MNTLESCHLCENCASVNESKLRLLKEREIAFNNFRELNEFSNSLGHFLVWLVVLRGKHSCLN